MTSSVQQHFLFSLPCLCLKWSWYQFKDKASGLLGHAVDFFQFLGDGISHSMMKAAHWGQPTTMLIPMRCNHWEMLFAKDSPHRVIEIIKTWLFGGKYLIELLKEWTLKKIWLRAHLLLVLWGVLASPCICCLFLLSVIALALEAAFRRSIVKIPFLRKHGQQILLREVVDAPSLEVLKIRLDGVLSNLV